ncbi:MULTISPECIES: PA2779 family protein [Halomonadaceae]|uniref:PA2779 family protein n=1 Tax=Halomonadaceae TaxID=28256 RepID=UPI0015824958|nr:MULTISPECIES: PA2779 family protein [Halomonas]MDI4637578.1 PA2779 family protein [Halomonas sp. BMC7]NUJ58598.1 PA2779 family protein [Halomonas taeanensis]
MKKLARVISPLLIAFLVLGSLPAVASVPATQANGLVSTQDALSASQVASDRERINELLAREDVQQQLLLQGVQPAEVKARVAALSDEEVSQMANQLDEMPAGASVVGALFAVFVILLVTDILGLTNVYPFVR